MTIGTVMGLAGTAISTIKGGVEVVKEIKNVAKGFDADKKAEVSNVSYSKKVEFNPDEKAEISKYRMINEDLAGRRHPVTDVLFEKKIVKDSNGNEFQGVFPVFDSIYDVKLPKELERVSDKEQFAECNNQLRNSVENNSELSKKFNSEQLEQIKNGDIPDGYVWHHNEEKGKM